MNKLILFLGLFSSASLSCLGQKKTEHIVIKWPGEYDWKIVKQADNGNAKTTIIIPGNETVANASIIGYLTAYSGVELPKFDEIVGNYRSRLDTGSRLTVIATAQNDKYPWAIFKVETPITNKYPEPESDLYYVVIGKYGLYENFVGIKKDSLSDEFVKKWTAIFKTSEIKIE